MGKSTHVPGTGKMAQWVRALLPGTGKMAKWVRALLFCNFKDFGLNTQHPHKNMEML